MVLSNEGAVDTPPGQEKAQELPVPLEKRPRHIAIIMDGNGRWAAQRGWPRIEGHRRGVQAVGRVVRACVRWQIPFLTLYCLSSENWKRPPQELSALMELLGQFMVEARREILRQNIRLRILGRREGIPDHVLREMDKTVSLSAENRGLCLSLAINYGGRSELVDAVRTIVNKVRAGKLDPDQINDQVISDHLYTSGLPDPDLLIRTAGEMRVSNFLLWQISYAELWVTQDCWPDFTEEHLRQAICDYAQRVRRFGGL
ncbi:MAG: isoprenyl transferase [Thermoguttaceae bacterium]|nr:isoprenyl transferase [Thermoguttaceae bacterium]MDW8077540.1 isoprenyl transferase [Thermoguttaceae bacterium]